MRYPSNKALLRSASVVIICMIIGWGVYLFFGHHLIESAYKGESMSWLSGLLQNRATTPLEAYYGSADRLLVQATFWTLAVLVVGAIVTFIVRQPVGVLMIAVTLTLTSLIFFSAFELVPSLIVRFGLDRIDYYAWNNCCLPDSTLVFRYRPLMDQMIPFKGYMYSPVYRVDVPATTMHLTTDKDGFIHNNAAPEMPDVTVIGDSFIGDAFNESDTFSSRLQAASGLKVANLGVAGYGPFQYVEVLKKYGIPQKPRYAFFVFYAGNDIEDIRGFWNWQAGEYYVPYILSRSFPRRYLAAASGFGRFLTHFGSATNAMVLGALGRSYTPVTKVHPDVSVVQLGSNTYKMLLTAENKEPSTDGLLMSREGQDLKRLISEFKSLCMANGITPLMMYIPTAAALYSEYSTSESGQNWLALRDRQIERKRVTENAVATLAREIDIPLFDLTIPFEAAARDGELLYYTFDTHWNPRGREVAANYVAAGLKSVSTDTANSGHIGK